jgi:hypothetical protein
MLGSSLSVPRSEVYRDGAKECQTMAALFRSEKARALILRLAADYERLADQAAMLELQDADRDAGIIPPNTAAPTGAVGHVR